MISDERRDKALEYLVTTDETAANLKADVARAEYKAKAIKEAVYLRLDGSVADRQAKAGQDAAYSEAMQMYFNLLGQAEYIKNKRQTESIVIDVWRSDHSDRKKGNI